MQKPFRQRPEDNDPWFGSWSNYLSMPIRKGWGFWSLCTPKRICYPSIDTNIQAIDLACVVRRIRCLTIHHREAHPTVPHSHCLTRVRVRAQCHIHRSQRADTPSPPHHAVLLPIFAFRGARFAPKIAAAAMGTGLLTSLFFIVKVVGLGLAVYRGDLVKIEQQTLTSG